MKRLAKITLTILTILLLSLGNSGCAGKEEPRLDVVRVLQYDKCPAPPEPNYGELNREEHIANLSNLEMMRHNYESALRDNDSLRNTIKCYENQTKEAEMENE